MHATSIIIVESTVAVRDATSAAARNLFPDSTVREVSSVAAAIAQPAHDGTELLIVTKPDTATLAAASAAVASSGAPRWGVVALGATGDPAGIAANVSLEAGRPVGLDAALKIAARIHALELENFRLRGDLATMGRRISHDLRAPLGGIYSACDAINEITPGNPTDPRIFTESITTSVDELVQLIDRVSFILKVSAEPQVKETALMGEIVIASLQRLEKLAHKSETSITQPANWPVVMANPTALELIWSNFIRNAIQHGGQRGEISLGWSENADEFLFWVDDRGPGVREDRVNRLFQPFNLLHRLNSTRGLGLSLTQRLAQLEGGRAGYEPRKGGGSRFYFTLPKGDTLPEAG
jgi:signal transduction histidine kinase